MNDLSKFTDNKKLPYFENPFSNNNIHSVFVMAFGDSCMGEVTLRNGESTVEQKFKDKSMDVVLFKMKEFIEAL